MRQIGIIAGLRSELRRLGAGGALPAHLVAFAAGGSPARARAEALRWAAEGRVAALASFGLCGGLDPSLSPGDVVVAHRVVFTDGGALEFDARWAEAIAARIPGARIAPILGAGDLAAGAAEKRALFERHAASAIDMESRGVAEAAHDAGLPFVALRAVADPADRTLPRAAAHAVDERGRVRVARVLLGLAGRPGDLGALMAVGGDARRAHAALAAAAARALHPDLVPLAPRDAPVTP